MLNILIVYLLEALAISIVAYYIPKNILSMTEIFKITLTGAITYLLLDLFSPLVGAGLRFGTGINIGKNMINKPVSLFGGEDDCGCENDPDCEEVCQMLKGGGRFNRKIGGENNPDNELCIKECGEDNDECIEGCNLIFTGGKTKSYPLQLNGGNEDLNSIDALCAGIPEMDYEECKNILEQE